MSRRTGKGYLVLIQKQDTYATAVSSSMTILGDKFDAESTTAEIQENLKTGTFETYMCESLPGYEGASVTLEGPLTVSHSIMLEAAYSESAANTFTVPESQIANNYYTIIQYFPTDSKGVVMTGCYPETISITGASGDKCRIASTWRAKDIAREVDLSSASASSGDIEFACNDVFLFADVTGTVVSGSTTSFNSFNLTMTNEFADDTAVFQNSNTKTEEIQVNQSNTLGYEWNYDTVNDAGVYDNLLASNIITDSIVLVSDSDTWTITTRGKYKTYSAPDPDIGVYVASTEKELMRDSTNVSLQIAIT